MSKEPSLASERELRLQEVLAEYIGAVEAGQVPDRAALLERHPDLADELIIFFANQEALAVRARPSTHTDQTSRVGSSPAPSAQPAPGRANVVPRIGDFEILHELARGGMGVVYRARQISLGREVALKMILTNKSTSPLTLRRFQTEAEAAAHLDHPNIVPVYEVGQIEGDPYFTMKLVEGGSLSSRLAEYGLRGSGKGPRLGQAEVRATLRRSVGLLATVARAVHHAHLRGILHRDLKPGNILLDGEGRPMVADFGLAKRFDQDTNLTQSLTVLGTATYMAPEQARPRKDGLTTATDVYSLGAIFYELLTGRPPLVGNTPFDTLLKVSQEQPVPPRQRNPNVPRDLELICLKCLDKDPAGRYASALDLAEDLERWLAGDTISLRQATASERAWRSARRHPGAVALLATVAVALVAATVVSLTMARQSAADRDREAAIAREQTLLAEEKTRLADAQTRLAEEQTRSAERERAARDLAEKAGVENRRLLVSGYVANGTRALDAGDPFGALIWYGGALDLDRGDAAREEAHRVRLAAALRRCPQLVQVWFDNDDSRPTALSPDGKRIALLRKDSARVWDVNSGEAVSAAIPLHGVADRVGFSPNGKRLFTVEKRAARVWDAVTGKPLTPPLEHDKPIGWATFSPDGARLATVGADKNARVWDAATGKLLAGPLAHDQPVLFASFSPDGKRLTTCGGDYETHKGEIRVWDLTAAKPTSRKVTRPGVVSWAHLAPDGEHVVAAGGRRTAHVWSLDTHRAENPPAVSFVRLEPSGEVGPDPTRVLRLDGSTVRVYDATTAKPAGPPLVHGAPVTLAVFSPDGSLVATAARDHTARVWDAATGKPLTPPLRHGRVIYQAAFSDNGKRLLTASEDGVVRVWDLAPRDPVQPLATLAKGGPSALSPDGRLVAITDAKGAVWVCDSASNKVIHGPWKLNRPATAVLFSPDGRRVLAASEGDGRVWDVGTGEAVTPVLAHSGPVKRLLYAAGGKRFAIQGGNDRLETYDAATGSLLYSHALPVKDTPGGPALTPDGNAVAVVSRSGMDVEIRDVVSGERRAGPFRHAALVAATAVSPDGTRLAVATADGTVFLWDVATGRPAAPVMQHGAPLRQVAFSGDGRFLASVAEDHTGSNTPPDSPRSHRRSRARRGRYAPGAAGRGRGLCRLGSQPGHAIGGRPGAFDAGAFRGGAGRPQRRVRAAGAGPVAGRLAPAARPVCR
jgi:WD40 repeat protein/tRNA A-37 threonylcarbamoyl transferase component Bud32